MSTRQSINWVARLVIIPLVVSFVSIGMGGVGFAETQKLTKVRIALCSYQDLLSIVIGKLKGWDKEEGLDFEFIEAEWREAHEFLAAGAVDFTSSAIGDEVSRAPNVPDAVFSNLLYFFAAHGMAVRPDAGMKTYWEFRGEGYESDEAVKKTMQQVKGKTIILTKGLGMDAALKKAAEVAGLDYPEDFTLIDMGHYEGLAAFMVGSGDAYIGGIPHRLRLRQTGEGYKILFDESLWPETVTNAGFATTMTYINKHPDVPVKLQRIIFRILQYIERHPDEGLKIIVDELKKRAGGEMTVEDLKLAWNQMEFFPSNSWWVFKEGIDPGGDRYWRTQMEHLQDTYVADGTLPGPVDLEKIFYVSEVMAQYMKKYEPGTYLWTFGVAKRRFEGRPDEYKRIYGLDYSF